MGAPRSPTQADHRTSPARIAGIYLVFSLTWIWLSDIALARIELGGALGFWAAALKGSGFVLFTTAVLYLLVRREVRQLTRALSLLRAVADGTPDAVFVKDRKGKYLLFNEAAARFVGQSVADVLGKDDTDIFDARSATIILANDRRVMETGRAEMHEGELTAAGVTRTYMATKAPYRDANGQVIGLVGISRDITDRKRAEGALRASEERFRALVELAPDAIVLIRDGRIAFANAAAARGMLAPSPAVLIGLVINDHIHPDDLGVSQGQQVAILQKGEIITAHEIRVRRLDGEYTVVETCSGPCVIDGAAGIQLIARDVTERNRGAAFLARQAAILERIATGSPLPEVLDEIVRMVEEQLPGVVGSILLLDRDGRHLRHGAAPNLPPEYNAAVNGLAIGPDVGSCGTAAYTRKPVLVNDIETDPLWVVGKVLALPHGLRSCWSAPIFAAPRGTTPPTLLGTFAVYGRSPGPPHPRFAELIAGVEHVASIAIESDRAARDLRDSEERYRSLVESSTDGIFVNEGGARITYANPAFLRIIGASTPDQVLGKSPLEFVHPDYHALVRARIQRVHETGEPAPPVELRHVRLDGSSVEVEATGVPFQRKGVLAIHVTVRDITERKRAEESLRQSEMRYRMTSELTSDYVYSIRFQRTPTVEEMVSRSAPFNDYESEWVTQSFTAITGYDWQELHGLGGWLRLIHPDDLPGLRTFNERRLAGQAAVAEYRIRKKGGEVRWLRDYSRPIRDNGAGAVIRLYGAVQDITERRHLEDQLRQSQKMEAVGRLAGGVAHDFNNLLTVINGFCDLALRDVPPEDPRREGLAHIRAAGERAARLTQQLLAYGRKAMVEPKVWDLNELIIESTKLLRRLIGEDVVVATLLQSDLSRVKVDRGQIEQVLMNLAVNARDAMPRGGRITIETRNVTLAREDLPDDPDLEPGRYVRLTVADTGTGMTEEVKAHIFEPFFTTKEQGKGTGLGLAVVHGAIKQNGGHISVSSAPGAGTTFTILFPAAAEVAPPASGVRRLARGTETILLVEDEESVRTITRIGLEHEGYTVLAAGSGSEALGKAERHGRAIELLITDVVMPHMGGRQLAETLLARQPSLRVLYVSGYTDDVVLIHGLAQSPGAFLQKPFTPLELARKVREILDSRS
jgi:PAS domain S-box-containing protein